MNWFPIIDPPNIHRGRKKKIPLSKRPRRTLAQQVDDALLGATVAAGVGMIILFLGFFLGRGCAGAP